MPHKLENLPIINREDLVNIDETIVTEIKMQNKKVFFILSYRSPSHNSAAEVDDYCNKLQVLIDHINKEKPSMVVLTGDFNARSPLFWDQEADETLPGRKLNELMLLNCMDQIIDEPIFLMIILRLASILFSQISQILLFILVLFNHLILDASTK